MKTLFLSLSLILISCSEPMPPATCGNGALESHELCDPQHPYSYEYDNCADYYSDLNFEVDGLPECVNNCQGLDYGTCNFYE